MVKYERPEDYLPMEVHRDLIEDCIIDFATAKGKKNRKKASDQLMMCFPDCFNASNIISQMLFHMRFIHPDLLSPAEYNRVAATLNLAQSRIGDFMQSEVDQYQERVNNICKAKNQ